METKKTSAFALPLLLSLVLILGMFLGYKLSRNSIAPNSSNSLNSRTHLDDLIQLISSKYVDSLDQKKLYESGVEGILKHLDPHTVFIPASELGRVNEELEGNFFGIGVEFFVDHDTVIISSIIKDGPSEKQNIQAGDRILKINDSLVAGVKLSDEAIIGKIKGEQNTSVKLTLLRVDGSLQTATIARGNVSMKSILASYKINENVGFIKISLFGETTADEFHEALADLKKQGISKLIIDVRDNPGGYMDAVADIADELISGEHTIVSTKGNRGTDVLKTHKEGLFETGQLAILVNENSASAAEILAGSIQDLDRGVIVGRRTFGKGLVQEQFELPDGSAIRITTARYYLPSGRCIQKSYAKGKEEYEEDILKRYTKGELQFQDSVRASDSVFYTINKHKVYGAQGVSPTVFVALDTTAYASVLNYYESHLTEKFAFSYFYNHKKEFEVYKNLNDFDERFVLLDSMRIQIKNCLESNKVNTFFMNNVTEMKRIQSALASQFARLLYGNNGRYMELYKQDDFVLKALNAMP